VPLQNVAYAVSFLHKSLFERPETSYIGRRKPIKRIFWLIGIDDVDWNIAHACDPIPGTPKLHSICALNQYDVIKLMVKELACFCCFCMETQCFCMFVFSMDKGLEARNIKAYKYSFCAIYHGRGRC